MYTVAAPPGTGPREGLYYPMNDKLKPTALLTTIFLVNFLSLVYQVVWVRKIMVIFGTTALSISTILTVFLSGIALGGYIGSEVIYRVRDLRRFCAYALIALGAYCLLSIYLFGLIKYPFQAFVLMAQAPLPVNLFKLALSFVILIFPTTVIGMMFPLVTHLYSKGFGETGRRVASIYFLDTLGASIGALLCGFFLVPYAGLAFTSFVSGLIYVCLGLLVLLMPRGGAGTDAAPARTPAKEGQEPGKNPRGGARTFVLTALFFSGFAALVLEVAWSRFFHLLFGTSIYAFSLVVAAFLLGLAVGSVVIRMYLDRLKEPLVVFAYIEVLIAGFSLLTMHTSSWIEVFYFKTFQAINDFYLFQGALFAVAFALMLIPTSLMGANFPLAIKILGRREETVGNDAGVAFAFNTAGGIIGAFAAGFLIIPALGLQNTNILSSVIYLVIGVLFVLAARRRAAVHLAVVSALAAAFALFGYLKYGEPELNYSVYYNGITHKTLEGYLDFKKREKIVFSKHGYYGLVNVSVDPSTGHHFLQTNGKIDASTTRGDMELQILLGHVPFFLHKNPERVLNIGLGGGFTLGAIKTHANVKAIDTVEIDPLVAEATAGYFAPYNNDALNDRRSRLIIQDGRHYIETTSEKYDVIISEPPNIWVSGVAQLFTREFYNAADGRLNPGGILMQWVPAYELGPRELKIILKTIKERFEHVAYWTNDIDVLILASHDRPFVDPAYVEDQMKDYAMTRQLNTIFPGIDPRKMARILSNPRMPFDAIEAFIKDAAAVNTDNLPVLEFNTAQNIFKKTASQP